MQRREIIIIVMIYVTWKIWKKLQLSDKHEIAIN